MFNRKEKSGRLRNVVYLLKPLYSRDDSGGQIQTWIKSGGVWANFEARQTKSLERESDDRYQDFLASFFTVRYSRFFTEDMKILYERKEWDIKSIKPDEYNEMMVIEAVSGTPTEKYWVDAQGREWVDGNNQPFVAQLAGDEKRLATQTEEWTDGSGVIWNPE